MGKQVFRAPSIEWMPIRSLFFYLLSFFAFSVSVQKNKENKTSACFSAAVADGFRWGRKSILYFPVKNLVWWQPTVNIARLEMPTHGQKVTGSVRASCPESTSLDPQAFQNHV